jgi:hypothetical protein
MKIQFDLKQELNKALKLYKINNELKSLPEAAVKILTEKLMEDKK